MRTRSNSVLLALAIVLVVGGGGLYAYSLAGGLPALPGIAQDTSLTGRIRNLAEDHDICKYRANQAQRELDAWEEHQVLRLLDGEVNFQESARLTKEQERRESAIAADHDRCETMNKEIGLLLNECRALPVTEDDDPYKNCDAAVKTGWKNARDRLR